MCLSAKRTKLNTYFFSRQTSLQQRADARQAGKGEREVYAVRKEDQGRSRGLLILFLLRSIYLSLFVIDIL